MTDVDVVIPVYNEARILEASVRRLHDFLRGSLRSDWRITIAENGSTDATPQVAERLSRTLGGVRHLAMREKGRGRALRAAWLASDARLRCYMDVDLATGLEALPRLLEALDGGAELATGDRFHDSSKVDRGVLREVLSRGYRGLVRGVVGTSLRDLQCGFKGLTAHAARRLLPVVRHPGWFFDTELLVLGERAGFPVASIPVRWVQGRETKVRVVRDVARFLADLVAFRGRMGKARLAVLANGVEAPDRESEAVRLEGGLEKRRPLSVR